MVYIRTDSIKNGRTFEVNFSTDLNKLRINLSRFILKTQRGGTARDQAPVYDSATGAMTRGFVCLGPGKNST